MSQRIYFERLLYFIKKKLKSYVYEQWWCPAFDCYKKTKHSFAENIFDCNMMNKSIINALEQKAWLN